MASEYLMILYTFDVISDESVAGTSLWRKGTETSPFIKEYELISGAELQMFLNLGFPKFFLVGLTDLPKYR